MEKEIFYIDSDKGNDRNSGREESSAWRSLDAVNRLTLHPGCEIRFRCGGKWEGMLSLHGDGERYNPVIVSSYGEGDAPEIDGAGNYAGILLAGCSHYVVEKLRVANRAEDQKVRQGICIEGQASGITEDITIQDCEVLDVDGQFCRSKPPYESMYNNSGIYVTMPGRSSDANHLHRIHILSNYIHDVKTSGIRVNQEEDGIVDIHHTAVVIRGNRIERTGADGIIVANSVSPLIVGNRCIDAGALGTKEDTKLIAGVWVCATSDALIQWNEVAGTRLFDDDGTAFDTDWGTKGTTIFQYNYTHGNEGGFWLDCSGLNYQPEYEKTILRCNISIQDGRGIQVWDQELPAEYLNNLFVCNPGASVCVHRDGRGIVFKNNVFDVSQLSAYGWGKAFFSGNRYLDQQNPADERGSFEEWPGLKALKEMKDHTDWDLVNEQQKILSEIG